MQFPTSLIAFLPLMASMALAAPIAEPVTALQARTDLPKECHFLNDDISSHKMICEYTSPSTASPEFYSNLPDACKPDPSGEYDVACKLPPGAKGFSINKKRDVAGEAYKFRLVCDDKGCHYGPLVARGTSGVEAEAYKFIIVIEFKKRDEVAIAQRAVAKPPVADAYIFRVIIQF